MLPNWLAGRAGVPADLAFAREFRDIAGRIAELNALFTDADETLAAVLAGTLTREALGVAGETGDG